MPTVKELLRTGRKEDLWQMCCGFLDLSIEQFMSIQKRLLLEQIELLNASAIGRKIFKGTVPQDVEEFRKRAPLTTYQDYCPELSEKKDDAMPVKPLLWQHTSGRSAEYPFKWETIKWTPVTQRMCEEIAKIGAGLAILASCKHKGDVSGMKRGARFIYAVAPRPYTSGTYAYIATEEVEGISMPPLEIAEKLDIEERIQLSFKQALSQGLDFYFGVSIALVAIGEKINQRMGKVNIKSLLSQPRALARLAKGLIKSKLAGRKLMPKDLWTLKGILGSGTDATIFKNVIKDTWGVYPLDVYVSTEGSMIATQAWDYDGMTFIPHMNFYEFIPEAEYDKWKEDRSYIPGSVLLDKVQPHSKYELVISNFHGGPLVRYRTGDIVKITSLRNNKLNIELPQMEFEGRMDDVIDIGGFARLTEKVIWQAISNTAIPYVDWVARKEQKENRSFLHVYLELKEDIKPGEDTTAGAIYTELKKMDEEFLYGNVETVLNTMPVEVTLLPKGAFENYINLRRSQGADLAHLKPRHLNLTDKELAILGAPVPASPEADRVYAGAPAAS
jgi:hypothetical protein